MTTPAGAPGKSLGAGHSHYIQVASDVYLHVLEFSCNAKSDVESTAVVLVHGWPDCLHSWRHQVPALTATGAYRVLLVDLPGFNLSSLPVQLEKYTFKCLVEYLCTALDYLEIPRAVFIGHDWGGSVVWHTAWRRPDRCLAVAALCTPFRPPTKRAWTPEEMAAKMPYFQYQVYFNSPDAEVEFNRHPARNVLLMLTPSGADGIARRIGEQMKVAGLPRNDGSGRLHGLFDRIPDDVDVDQLGGTSMDASDRLAYATAFQRTGFGPGFNYYRTHALNWRDSTALIAQRHGEFRVHVPALMLTAGRDVVLSPKQTDGMEAWCSHLERAHIEDAGHFVQFERADATNAVLLSWLERVCSPDAKRRANETDWAQIMRGRSASKL